MYVLGEWKPVAPGGLVVVYKDAEVLFKPLVCAFRLSISLGVISRAYVLLDVQYVIEFLGEVGSEVGITSVSVAPVAGAS